MNRPRLNASSPARLCLVAAALALSAAGARAEGETVPAEGLPATPEALPGGGPQDPLWEIGLFGFGSWQPAYPGSDTHLRKGGVLPYAVYRGRIVRLEGGALGLRAIRTPRYEWDLTGSFSFGGGANTVRARAGMPTIGTLAGMGPALRINLGDLEKGPAEARSVRLDLPARAIFDLNDAFAYKGWSFEPTLGRAWKMGDAWSLRGSVGMLFGDRQLNSLFYGVDPAFATPDRPAYRAKAGLIATRLNGGIRYRISPTLRLYGAATWETVAGAATEGSPLVKRRQDLDLGVGLIWVFGQSDARASE